MAKAAKGKINKKRKSYKKRILKTLYNFKDIIININNIDELILFIEKMKSENKISKLLGLSIHTIEKHFGDFENLKNKIKNYEDNENTKTRSSN